MMKSWTDKVCPVCGSSPLVKIWKRTLTKDEIRRCNRKRKFERLSYFHCSCDEIVTEWHRPSYKRNGKEESKPAEYYAAREWEQLVDNWFKESDNTPLTTE